MTLTLTLTLTVTVTTHFLVGRGRPTEFPKEAEIAFRPFRQVRRRGEQGSRDQGWIIVKKLLQAVLVVVLEKGLQLMFVDVGWYHGRTPFHFPLRIRTVHIDVHIDVHNKVHGIQELPQKGVRVRVRERVRL